MCGRESAAVPPDPVSARDDARSGSAAQQPARGTALLCLDSPVYDRGAERVRVRGADRDGRATQGCVALAARRARKSFYSRVLTARLLGLIGSVPRSAQAGGQRQDEAVLAGARVARVEDELGRVCL